MLSNSQINALADDVLGLVTSWLERRRGEASSPARIPVEIDDERISEAYRWMETRLDDPQGAFSRFTLDPESIEAKAVLKKEMV